MGALMADMRHAFRVLIRNAGSSTLAILCLGFGIAVQTTMFSGADPWLFRPLPYNEPERIVALREANPLGANRLASVPVFFAWKQSASLSELGAVVRVGFNLSTENEPERIRGARITASLFPLLGVQPVEGRLFTPEEDSPGGHPVCLIGEALWRRHFGGRSGVVGATLKIDGEAHTIVGMMPAGWAFPEQEEVWTPLRLDPAQRDFGARGLDVVGRLRPGATLASAGGELDALARRVASESPETSEGWGFRVMPLLEQLTPPGIRTALFLMLAAGTFVLLIACANVATLLLAQGIERRREIATRLALGAGTGRIVRQMLVESLLIALAGGALGVALGHWGNVLLASAIPVRAPFWATMDINLRVLWVTLLSCVLASVAAGLLPALEAARLDVRGTLQDGGRSGTAGARARRLGNLLVGAELAASVVLLSGALLMIRSFEARQSFDLGIDPSGVLSARVTLSGERYREPAARWAFIDELVRRARTLPGVEEAAAVTSLLMSDEFGGGWSSASFEVDGQPVPVAKRPSTVVQGSTAGGFAALGIAIRQGRGFHESEVAEGADVAVVSEGLARRFWPGGEPLGRRLRLANGEWLRIVGVAADVREPSSILGLTDKPAVQVYVPYARRASSGFNLVLRARQETGLAGALREEVRRLDPLLPVYDVRTLHEARRSADWVARLWGQMLGWAAAAGALLACAGVFGVISRSVARRTQEIGVRMALGADRRSVLRLVLGQGLRLALLGIAVGVLGTLALTRALAVLLHGVSPTDPVSLLASPVALLLVAVVATYVPARRATAVDPMTALRCE
jgi:putative ABC transport system permease protein